MGQIAVAVKHLMAAGITGEALLRAIEEMESVASPPVPVAPAKKVRDPNSPKAKYMRDKRNSGGSSGTDGTSMVVPEQDGTSDFVPVDASLSPHTPLSENINISTTREAREPTLTDLEAECRKWANGSLVENFDGAGFAAIERLMNPASGGEPCIRDDVRVGITDSAASLHAKGRRNDIATFAYFEEPILRARDKRLTPLRKVEIIDERAGEGQSGQRGRDASRKASRRSRNQYGGNGILAGVALLYGDSEEEVVVSDRPEDWRNDRVA